MLQLLVCSLNSCLEQWGVAEDVYCLGPTSRIIGAELASLPWAKGRRKVNLILYYYILPDNSDPRE